LGERPTLYTKENYLKGIEERAIILNMISRLRIENFILIDQADIEFESGLTALTGESGSGKSIIINALLLLLGHQASDDFIKSGSDTAIIEGEFKVDPLLLPEQFQEFLDGESSVIVFRKITKDKGNAIRVNNQTVTLKFLKDLMFHLMIIVGQHDKLDLFDQKYQLNLLDHFASDDLEELSNEYKAYYSQYKLLTSQFNRHQKSNEDVERKIEFLDFQINDIESQDFLKNEETLLLQRRKEIRNLQQVKFALGQIEGHFLTISDTLNQSVFQLKSLIDVDSYYQSLSEGLETMLIDIEDKSHQVKSRVIHIQDLDTKAIDEIESRLDIIFQFFLIAEESFLYIQEFD